MDAQMDPTFLNITDKTALEEGELFAPRFDEDGLLPAIVSDVVTGDVLMFAWMDAQALFQTLETGYAHFWSRSRKALWKKGEESGNVLRVRDVRTDCDQDVLLLRVDIEGDRVACHTKRRTCFYRRVSADGSSVYDARLQFIDDDGEREPDWD